ncbi:unnamed protein product [Effrenium voratum]|nr:unnamed protein product [Effrenium voratum]
MSEPVQPVSLKASNLLERCREFAAGLSEGCNPGRSASGFFGPGDRWVVQVEDCDTPIGLKPSRLSPIARPLPLIVTLESDLLQLENLANMAVHDFLDGPAIGVADMILCVGFVVHAYRRMSLLKDFGQNYWHHSTQVHNDKRHRKCYELPYTAAPLHFLRFDAQHCVESMARFRQKLGICGGDSCVSSDHALLEKKLDHAGVCGPGQLLAADLTSPHELVAPHLLESGDFTVVAALGCQGGGRSTVLSTLLSPYFYSEGATPSYHTFKVPLGIHSAQSFLEGQASPAGVDLCITTDRLVLLDAQPLFDSISASPDADLRSELFLNIFLASICHTILVVTDTAVDMQLWRFMRLLGSLKSKVPDLATWLKQEKQAPKEETKEVAPNLLVVFNNMSPDSEGALEEPVQSFLQRTEWKAGPIRCLTAPRLPGRSFQEMLCSEQAAALGARLRQNLFQQGNCQGCFGHSLQLTEKQWLHHVLDYWDFVQKHPAASPETAGSGFESLSWGVGP